MAKEGRELSLAESCSLMSVAAASMAVELEVLRRALYRQHSQHRATLYFQPLRQVKRHLELLASMDVSGQLLQLLRLTEDANRQLLSDAKKTQISPPRTSSQAFREIPQRLLGASHLMRKTNDFICKAASFMGTLLSQSFFMPLALTLLASLARCHTLLLQMMRFVENAQTSVIARGPIKAPPLSLPLSAVEPTGVDDPKPSQKKGSEKERGGENKVMDNDCPVEAEGHVIEFDTRKSEEMAILPRLSTETSYAFEKKVSLEKEVGFETEVGSEKEVDFELSRSSGQKQSDSGVKRTRLNSGRPSPGQLPGTPSAGREPRGRKTPSRQKQTTPTGPLALDDIFQQLLQ